MVSFCQDARSSRAALAGLFVVLAGCRDEQAGPRGRSQKPSPARSEAAPATGPRTVTLTYQSGATWAEGAILYIGASVEPSPPVAGQPVTIRNFFKAQKQPPPGYHFFAHLVDVATGQMLGNLDHDIRGAEDTASWEVGRVIEDAQAINFPQLPPGQKPRLLIGFWQGNQRLPVDQPDAHDGLQRMLGPTLDGETGGSLPEYVVQKTPQPPTLDGILDDPVWANAKPVELVQSFDGRKPALKTLARMLFDDKNLYVSFDCEDPDVWGTLKNRDESIYNEEVVEIFLDADANGRTYNELEVSPNNTIFDAYFPARRQGMDLSWDSGMRSAVKVRGTVNDNRDRDEGWSVEMVIPFATLSTLPHTPPQHGDRWRFNLYRLEHLNRSQVEGQAFSPLFLGDFHNLPRFGWLVFE